MTQVSKYPISKEIADRIFEIFVQAIIGLDNKKDTEEFLDNLLSPIERVMLVKRLSIAFLLEKGYSHRDISKILRVSLPTVVSVNSSRLYGSKGYLKVVNKILKEEKFDELVNKILLSAVSVPAKATKGGSGWRYLKEELEKNKKKTGFSV